MGAGDQVTAALQLRGIRHGFDAVPVLDHVDLSVRCGETVCIIGPSGCGKSTLLQIGAGLLVPSEGSVVLDGLAITGRPGSVAFMPQNDLLFPWRSAAGNVATALEIQGASRAEALAQAERLLGSVGLAAIAGDDVRRLSGGMRQRVAFVRTLAQRRPAMLLDEPFGALDQLTRASLHQWFRDTTRTHPAAVVIVTHDPGEAVMLGDRVIAMTPQPGRIGAVIDVELTEDRASALVHSDAFVAIEQDVRRALATRAGAPSHQHSTTEVPS